MSAGRCVLCVVEFISEVMHKDTREYCTVGWFSTVVTLHIITVNGGYRFSIDYCSEKRCISQYITLELLERCISQDIVLEGYISQYTKI